MSRFSKTVLTVLSLVGVLALFSPFYPSIEAIAQVKPALVSVTNTPLPVTSTDPTREAICLSVNDVAPGVYPLFTGYVSLPLPGAIIESVYGNSVGEYGCRITLSTTLANSAQVHHEAPYPQPVTLSAQQQYTFMVPPGLDQLFSSQSWTSLQIPISSSLHGSSFDYFIIDSMSPYYGYYPPCHFTIIVRYP